MLGVVPVWLLFAISFVLIYDLIYRTFLLLSSLFGGGASMEPAFGELLFTFSVNLYKQLASGDGNGSASNVLCSPLTVAAALCMTLAGARNDTARQIRALFGQHDSLRSPEAVGSQAWEGDRAIHTAFAETMGGLSSFSENVEAAALAPVTLRLANRLYLGAKASPFPEFSALLNSSYSASVANVDFTRDPESARRAINDWVSAETASKITELLPAGSVDSATCLALINAAYFRGLWENQFDPELTTEEPFYETPDHSRNVKMMYRMGKYDYGHHEGLGASLIILPYRGLKASMVVVLPDKRDGLADFEKRVTPSELSTMIANVNASVKVRLSLPRFRLSATTNLRHHLSAMGVTDLFGPRADLSGIVAPSGGPCGTRGGISVALHRASMEVTEEGTEAAAASVSVMTRRDLHTTEFTADHPFLFLVQSHKPSPTVLFIGSVRKVDDID